MIIAILILASASTLFSGLALFFSLVNRGWIIQTFSLVYRGSMESVRLNMQGLLDEEDDEEREEKE